MKSLANISIEKQYRKICLKISLTDTLLQVHSDAICASLVRNFKNISPYSSVCFSTLHTKLCTSDLTQTALKGLYCLLLFVFLFIS